MAGITEAIVEEIKSRVDLVDLISSYGVAVKNAGATKKACCPFHHEKTPSFNINESKGYYHCFGCGESGDAIKFVEKMEGLSFVEAVKKLASQCGIAIEEHVDPEAVKRKRLYTLMAELAAFYHRCLGKIKEAELAREYLKGRDLDEAAQEAWTIGYAPAGMVAISRWAEKYKFTMDELVAAGITKAPSRPGDKGYHRFGGRLMFTIRDKQGRVIGFSGRQLVASKNSGKYVNSPETPIFKKSHVLFGFDRAASAIAKDAHHEVIVCEGQIDCIRLHLKGFTNAVASQGTAFTEEHMKMLRRVSETAVLVFDDDAAGHKAAIRSAGMLLAYGMPVRVVSLPNGDDPDSYLRSHQPEEFKRLLDAAESIVSFQCRVERAKERNPNSVDAVSRVVKAVLATIAQSDSEVLKATMLTEASKLLALPTLALQDELRKLKSTAPAPVVKNEESDESGSLPEKELATPPIAGVDAHTLPPPPLEMAFMGLLLANEYTNDMKLIDGMIGEFMPREVFQHDFTWRFVECWRAEAASGEDHLASWSEQLEIAERQLFDKLLVDQNKTEPCSMPVSEMMQDFVRAFWVEALKRRRGALPASGDAESLKLSMQLMYDLKRLPSMRWPVVKEYITAVRNSANS